MKGMRLAQWIVIVAVAGLFAVGCAKKPAPDAPETAAASAQEEAPRADVAEARPEAPQEVEESPVTEEPQVTDRERLLSQADATSAGLRRIHFEFDQHTLTPEAREILAGNADYMKANPQVRIRVEGHCDERGSDEYNLALGERRARAARDYLISLGIDAGRLSVISYGEEMPLERGASEAAWAKNRRAEFNVVSP